MGVKDPEKNRLYVAKHRAMKKENEETKKEYNALNASYIANHRNKQKEEKGVEEYKKKDPLEMVKATLLSKKYATEQELEAMEEKIMETINESVTFSENSPFPEASALYEDVYAEPNYPFIKE